MSTSPIRTKLVEGQPYVDEPVYAKPVHNVLAEAMGIKPPPRILVAYQKINLRWMKPGKGGLVPR